MKRLSCLSAVVFCVQAFTIITFAQGVVPTCHSLTSGNLTYTQNFNALASSGSTGSVVPSGFGFAETGTASNTIYGVGSGSGTNDTFSFGNGLPDHLDRAFGGVRGSATGVNPTIGACFTNNTGVAISSFSVTYDGEQWRLGAAGRVDRLDFQYSANATTILSGTWIDVNALDFTAPVAVLPIGQIDGNDPFNRVAGINSTISSLSVPNGGTLYIRYQDFPATGANDGLAIDNFSLTAALAPTAASTSISGRVTTADGRGIRNGTVTLSGGGTQNFRVLTSSFGYYRFNDLPVGETYVVTVASKRYTFANPSRVVSLDNEVSDADFTAVP